MKEETVWEIVGAILGASIGFILSGKIHHMLISAGVFSWLIKYAGPYLRVFGNNYFKDGLYKFGELAISRD